MPRFREDFICDDTQTQSLRPTPTKRNRKPYLTLKRRRSVCGAGGAPCCLFTASSLPTQIPESALSACWRVCGGEPSGRDWRREKPGPPVTEHPRCAQTLCVGCIRGGHMEGDLARSRECEAGSRTDRKRRERWLKRKLWIAASGNQFLNANDGFNVVVYPGGSIRGARADHRAIGYQRSSKLPYQTRDQARLVAPVAMIGMKHSEPWRR